MTASPVIIGRASLYLGDCRDILPLLAFDAIVADPPYGVKHKRGDGKINAAIEGDETPPDVAWMNEYPAIIWGGNNFCDQLPRSAGWMVWFKCHPDMAHHSMAELAWSNVTRTVRHYTEAYHGFMRKRDGWHHPNQKPPGLMRWCINHLPEASQTILDPFMGSGPTGIAAVQAGKQFIGIEIDPGYFAIACERIAEAQRQGDMFIGEAARRATPPPPILRR